MLLWFDSSFIYILLVQLLSSLTFEDLPRVLHWHGYIKLWGKSVYLFFVQLRKYTGTHIQICIYSWWVCIFVFQKLPSGYSKIILELWYIHVFWASLLIGMLEMGFFVIQCQPENLWFCLHTLFSYVVSYGVSTP